MEPGDRVKNVKKRDGISFLWRLLIFSGILLLMAIIFGQGAPAGVRDVWLMWDPNTESDLGGYKIYYKTESSGPPYNGTGALEGDSPITIPLESLDDPNSPEFIIQGLQDDQIYFFVATAYNEDDYESDYSNEVILENQAGAVLVGLTVEGSDSIYENNNAGYTATAIFSDGNILNVTSIAAWTEDSPYSTISTAGLLSTSEVTQDTSITVQVVYTTGGVTETATKKVTIVNVPSTNDPPAMPVIVYPSDGQSEVGVPATIATEAFYDPDGDSHKQSRWQISDNSNFSTYILDVTSEKHLTNLTIPHMVLKPNQSYYVRVQFFDVYSVPSEWSVPVMFTTGYFIIDVNEDGVPDDREVGGDVDFNLNGTPDLYEPDTIKCVISSDGTSYIAVEKISSSISDIEALDVVPLDEISDTTNMPVDLKYDLFAYRLRLSQAGGVARVRVYFSGGISAADSFHKYNTISGWYDYANHSTLNEDGTSLILEVKDGDYGDSDGVANGIIVDPGGVSAGGSYSISDMGTNRGSEGSGCFIATATYGSPLERHVGILIDFRDSYLVRCSLGRTIIKIYYKYSPALALYIERHEIMKSIVAFSLVPLLAFCSCALRFGILVTVTAVAVSLILLVILIAVLGRKVQHQIL